jgi:hypothetical protein
MTHAVASSGATPSIRFAGLQTIVIASALCFAACGPGGAEDPGEDVDSTVQAATNTWIGPISDEAYKNHRVCRTETGDHTTLATSAGCIGRYCDDMYLFCESAPAGVTIGSNAAITATPYVSEENGNPAAKCPAGTFITGLQAGGSYSDRVSALCVAATFNNPIWAPQGVICSWSHWLSEERGTTSWPYSNYGRAQDFGVGFAAASAFRCSSSYCDNMSFFFCSGVNAYDHYEFSTQDDRGYTENGDWSPGDHIGECNSASMGMYMTGVSADSAAISSELRPHRALCVGQNDRLDYYRSTNWNSHLRSHSVAVGNDRADTGTGDWDPGFWKAECARDAVMVGVSQTTTRRLSRILCAPMLQMKSNVSRCSALQYSHTSNVRLNTLSSDWDPSYSKNECGLNQVLKGVSKNPTTGEIHGILCCDQQPDAL